MDHLGGEVALHREGRMKVHVREERVSECVNVMSAGFLGTHFLNEFHTSHFISRSKLYSQQIYTQSVQVNM